VGGAHLVFVARRDLASAPYQDVYDEMRQLLDAAGLFGGSRRDDHIGV